MFFFWFFGFFLYHFGFWLVFLLFLFGFVQGYFIYNIYIEMYVELFVV